MKTIIIHGIKCGPGFPIDRAAKANKTAAFIKGKFPKVKTVHDALQPVRVDVTDADKVGAEPHEFMKCAFAKAACRVYEAVGVFIGIKGSWMIFEDVAIRFDTPATVAREMVSFDRHEDFATGVYRLSAVTPTRRLGQPWKKKNDNGKKRPVKNHGQLIPNHRTSRVRSED